MNEARAIVYSTSTCPYCVAAKALLDQENISYVEHDVSRDASRYKEFEELTERRTVPQIVLDGQHIGGYTDLMRHVATHRN